MHPKPSFLFIVRWPGCKYPSRITTTHLLVSWNGAFYLNNLTCFWLIYLITFTLCFYLIISGHRWWLKLKASKDQLELKLFLPHSSNFCSSGQMTIPSGISHKAAQRTLQNKGLHPKSKPWPWTDKPLIFYNFTRVIWYLLLQTFIILSIHLELRSC